MDDTIALTPPEPCYLSKTSIRDRSQTLGRILGLSAASDLYEVVERLGGKIQRLDDMHSTDMASITVATRTTSHEPFFTITLLPSVLPAKERWSIAHELGHLFLHSQYGHIPIKANHSASDYNELVEAEATLFASHLLMPDDAVEKVMHSIGRDSVALAAHFGVPESVAWQRMQKFQQK